MSMSVSSAEIDTLIKDKMGQEPDAVGLRVVPVEMVFKRLPRMVRDLSQGQGKRVRLEMAGQYELMKYSRYGRHPNVYPEL